MIARKYRKNDGIINPKPVEDTHEFRKQEPSQTVAVPSSRYSKGEGLIEPTAFFVVFSNGTEREKDYLEWIRNNSKRVRLEFFGIPESPDDLLLKLLKKKKEYDETASSVHPDKFYAVTDVDHFYNDIIRSRDGYSSNSIRLIISNPCFEVWLYYSKREDKFEGFEMPEEHLKLSKAVKHFLDVKIPGGCNPKKAVLDIRENIVRAKKNYSVDKNGIPDLFSTNMFILAENLLPYISDEIKAFVSKMRRQSLTNRR